MRGRLISEVTTAAAGDRARNRRTLKKKEASRTGRELHLQFLSLRDGGLAMQSTVLIQSVLFKLLVQRITVDP
jgi:hypothetical protein